MNKHQFYSIVFQRFKHFVANFNSFCHITNLQFHINAHRTTKTQSMIKTCLNLCLSNKSFGWTCDFISFFGLNTLIDLIHYDLIHICFVCIFFLRKFDFVGCIKTPFFTHRRTHQHKIENKTSIQCIV